MTLLFTLPALQCIAPGMQGRILIIFGGWSYSAPSSSTSSLVLAVARDDRIDCSVGCHKGIKEEAP
eukprot:5799880-Amphidinium_carterae.1